EEAIRQIGDRARASLSSYEALHKSLAEEAAALFRQLASMTGIALKSGGTSEKFAKRQKVQANEVLALARDFAKKHYQALLAKELSAVFRGVVGSVPEFLHDVNHCRLRLIDIEKSLAHAPSETDIDPALGPGKHLLAATA